MKQIEIYFLWFIIYSVLGWSYETLICSVEQRRFINRGFLNGPYCPIYGCGAVMDILSLGSIKNPVALFLLGALLACSLEYWTSWGMEKLFNARWWDYSNYRLNINGRVCFWGAAVFGLFSVVLIKFLHPMVSIFTDKIPEFLLPVLSVSLLIILFADAAYTITQFARFDETLKELTNHMDHAVQKANRYGKAVLSKISGNEICGKVSITYEGLYKKINTQERRMIKVFPKFQSMRYKRALEKVRKLLK